MISLYTVPVLFFLSSGNVTVDFTLFLPKPAVGCIAHQHLPSAANHLTITHFVCYAEDGTTIKRTITGVYNV